MLTTTDPKEIAKYEAGIKWYNEYRKQNNLYESRPVTDRQWTCIYAIRKKNPLAPEFKGETAKEASDYISMHG